MTIDQKIELYNKHKHLKCLKSVSENTLRKTEEYIDVLNLKKNYAEFNPILKEKLQKWEYGNLNDDIIEDIHMYQLPENEDIIFKCFWKTREGEKKPRLPRYYHYSIIKSIDKENFHKAF